ncbi:MAG: Ger(x)C family spore germination protein [Lysinibacillus sp.]
MIRYKRLGLLICCIPLIAGCWDNIEVEERGFVTGIAIDLANSEIETSPSTSEEQNPQSSRKNETPLQRDERVLNHQKDEDQEQNENNKYKLTQQLINPSNVGSQQSQKSNSMTAAFRNLSQTGDTIIEMNRDMIKQAGRRTNVTHLNVVLFSEAVGKEADLFADLMDIFLREKEMLRSVKVAITKDHAGDYLNILPEYEKIPSKYINNVLENKSNLDISSPLTVGQVQSFLLSKKSFIIPFINQVNDTTVNYEGLSVFSGSQNKIVGTLTGNDAKGYNFIKTKNQTGTINLEMDDNDVTFEILELHSKVSLKDKDSKPLQFEIALDIEAGIAEQYGSLDVMSEKNYKNLQKALEREIKQITSHTISILQNDYQADVIGLNDHLYEHYYPLWESIKDNWEEGENYFQQSKVDITVNATIEKPGNIIKSH